MHTQRYLASKQGEFVGKRLELSGLKKNGEEFPVELSISPIENGEGILFVGCLRDLTERNALRAAQDELARTARIVATSEIAASLAHEIDQPLSAIVVNAATGLRWLERSTANFDEVRATLKRIVNDGRHASEVISGIRSMFIRDVQERSLQDINELILAVLTIVGGEVEVLAGHSTHDRNRQSVRVLSNPRTQQSGKHAGFPRSVAIDEPAARSNQSRLGHGTEQRLRRQLRQSLAGEGHRIRFSLFA